MKNTRTQLRGLKAASKSSRQFKGMLWNKLSCEFDNAYPGISKMSWSRALAMPLAAFVVLVTMGTGTYAYASPEVTEDHPLYAIKTGIESIEEKFYRSPESIAEFHARMMERRISESEILLQKDLIAPENIKIIADEFGFAITSMSNVDFESEAREAILSKLESQNVRYMHLMTGFMPFAHEHGPWPGSEGSRNVIGDVRVKIEESNLTEDEKQELLNEVVEKMEETRREIELFNKN